MNINTIYLKLLFIFTAIAYSLTIYSKENIGEKIARTIQAGEDAYNAGDAAEAIKLFMKAKELSKIAKSPKDECLSTYNIGICYFQISENGEALKNYYEAYKISKEHKLGWHTESFVLNGIAGVYFEENNYKKARELAYQCYTMAKNQNDTSLTYTYAIDMALISNKEKKFDEAIKYIKEAQIYEADTNNRSAKSLAVEAETMFMQEKYDNVISIAQKQLDNKNSDKDDISIVLIYLINIYTSRNELDKAFGCVKQAKDITGLKNKPYLYESIAKLYKAKGDYRNALQYMDSLVVYNDSINNAKNRQLTENSKIKIEVMKFKADMDQQLSRMQQRHYILLLIICILVLLAAIAVIITRNQHIKNRNRQKMMELQLEKEQHEKMFAEEKAKSVELEAHYRQEIMKQSLEQKQKELAITNMFTSSRNKLIEDLLKYLTDIKEVQNIAAVKTLVSHLKQLLKTSNEQDNFIINFESANPDFIQKLKNMHPDLSASDIRFLSYVRMNMSTKDIASLTNINPESCKRRKIRISKKLGMESSSELYDYIINI